MELYRYAHQHLCSSEVIAIMKHLIFFLIGFAILTTSFAGCKKQAEVENTDLTEEVDSAAIKYYKLRSTGQYKDYVNAMQSCDGMPEAYKNNTALLLEHHQAEINKEKKGVKAVAVVRCEMHNNDKMANVFLNVSFNDGTTEEVILPLVHDGKQWRIQ